MSRWVRQIHRWLGLAFTAGVLTYIIYPFVLPHALRWRGARRTA